MNSTRLRQRTSQSNCGPDNCEHVTALNITNMNFQAVKDENMSLKKQISVLKSASISSNPKASKYFELWVRNNKENLMLNRKLSNSKRIVEDLHVKLKDVVRFVKDLEDSLEADSSKQAEEHVITPDIVILPDDDLEVQEVSDNPTIEELQRTHVFENISVTSLPSSNPVSAANTGAASSKSFTASAASSKSFTSSTASSKSFAPSATSSNNFSASAASSKNYPASAASSKSYKSSLRHSSRHSSILGDPTPRTPVEESTPAQVLRLNLPEGISLTETTIPDPPVVKVEPPECVPERRDNRLQPIGTLPPLGQPELCQLGQPELCETTEMIVCAANPMDFQPVTDQESAQMLDHNRPEDRSHVEDRLIVPDAVVQEDEFIETNFLKLEESGDQLDGRMSQMYAVGSRAPFTQRSENSASCFGETSNSLASIAETVSGQSNTEEAEVIMESIVEVLQDHELVEGFSDKAEYCDPESQGLYQVVQMEAGPNEVDMRSKNLRRQRKAILPAERDPDQDNVFQRPSIQASIQAFFQGQNEVGADARLPFTHFPQKRLGEGHSMQRIPPTEKKAYPQRRCVVCYRNKKRRESRFWCPECQVCFCFECFRIYHTKLVC